MDEFLTSAQETTEAEEHYNKTVDESTYFSSTVHKISPFRSFKSILPSMDKTTKSMQPGKLRAHTLTRGGTDDFSHTSTEPQGAIWE